MYDENKKKIIFYHHSLGTTGDNRSQFHKCAKFAGILRQQRQVLRCNTREGIAGEKVSCHFINDDKCDDQNSALWQVYIRDDRRQGTLSLCEVEVKAQAGNTIHSVWESLKKSQFTTFGTLATI